MYSYCSVIRARILIDTSWKERNKTFFRFKTMACGLRQCHKNHSGCVHTCVHVCVYVKGTKELRLIAKYGPQRMRRKKNAVALYHEYRLLMKSVHHISAFPKPHTNVEKVAWPIELTLKALNWITLAETFRNCLGRTKKKTLMTEHNRCMKLRAFRKHYLCFLMGNVSNCTCRVPLRCVFS